MPLNFSKDFYQEYIYPAYYFGKLDYIKASKLIKNAEYWKREKLIAYQTNKLKKILSFSYDKIPYYRNLFVNNAIKQKDIQSLEDLERIPILKREFLKNNLNNLTVRQPKEKEARKSSGSTGTPVKFFLDAPTMSFRNATYVRLLDMMGIKLTDRTAQFDAEVFLKPENHNRTALHSKVLNKIFLSSKAVSSDDLRFFAKTIGSFKPKLLVGPSSMLFLLANYVKENKLNIKVDKMLNIQENIDAHQRRFIEQTFDSEVFNFYSVNEQVCSAMECPSHNMHIYMCKGIIEVVNEKGRSTYDKEGRIIATGLTNYLMPLIRYEVGDLGVVTKKVCGCGRESLILKSVKGRTSDVFKYKDKIIHTSLFSVLLYKFKGFSEWQFIQDSEDSLTINVVKNKYFTESEKRKIVETFHKLTDKDLRIRICTVRSIPRGSSGKKKLFVPFIKNEKEYHHFIS